MTKLTIRHLAKSFGDKTVLADIDLDVPQGQLVSLLGPSGCGKTTTLNVVAGFLAPDSGQVLIGDSDVTARRPYERDTAVVFQNYALFPHMRVFDNVAYGLRARKVSKPDIPARVEEALRLVGISELRERYPAQLSGGQQQRVAVARALAVRPAVLLLDEPLSNLDAKLRTDIRLEIRALQQRLEQTALFVTHDQEEALSISDRIVLMNGGRIEQMGTPEELYDRPATRFAASFMGVENIFSGSGDAGHWRTESGLTLPLPGTAPHVGIRPSHVGLKAPGAEETTAEFVSLPVDITGRTYLGAQVRYLLRYRGTSIVALVGRNAEAAIADGRANVHITREHLLPLRE